MERVVEESKPFHPQQASNSYQNNHKFTCETNIGPTEKHVGIHSEAKPHGCEICGKTFRLRMTLKTHLRIHTGERPYECKICGHTFTQTSSRDTHVKTVHSEARPHGCKICGQTFTQAKFLDSHVRNCEARPHGCIICGKTFIEASSRDTHVKKVHNRKAVSIKPQDGSKTCGNKTYFTQTSNSSINKSGHVRTDVHINARPHGRGIKRVSQKKPHVSGIRTVLDGRTVNSKQVRKNNKVDEFRPLAGDVRPHGCVICRKTFKQRCHLNEHVRIHTTERPHSCGKCGKKFSRRFALNRHLKIHDGDQIIRPRHGETYAERKDVAAGGDTRPHGFNILLNGKPASNTEQITNLKTADHLSEERRPREQEYEQRKQGNLDDATIIVPEIIQIDDNNDERPQTSERTNHNEVIRPRADQSEELRPYECEETFLKRKNLDSHVIAVHEGLFSRPHGPCKICGKTFTRQCQLDAHVRIHNHVERPHGCEICGRNFTLRSARDEHVLFHTGQRPRECNLCGKFFREASHRNDHIKIHGAERPYECQICRETFELRSDLHFHHTHMCHRISDG